MHRNSTIPRRPLISLTKVLRETNKRQPKSFPRASFDVQKFASRTLEKQNPRDFWGALSPRKGELCSAVYYLYKASTRKRIKRDRRIVANRASFCAPHSCFVHYKWTLYIRSGRYAVYVFFICAWYLLIFKNIQYEINRKLWMYKKDCLWSFVN